MENLSGPDTIKDKLITRFDKILRVATGQISKKRRDLPGTREADLLMKSWEKRVSGNLMRVNHSGELCAQALYLGQSCFSREETTFLCLVGAALEEADHLHWCSQRLDELDAKPSKLNLLWVSGACIMGIVLGAVGDRASLGFVEETERQVVDHLRSHLLKLPKSDLRSRSIISVMLQDEDAHATTARANGGKLPPIFFRQIMAFQARVMTTVSYKL